LSDALKPGLSATSRIVVDQGRTIGFMGDQLRVYSTPSLLYDVEVACRELILPHVGEGKDSVGTRVEFDHVGATLLDMWVEITVKVAEVNGPAVVFEFSARDAVEEVARGKHNRFVGGLEKTAQRMQAKRAKASAA